MSKDDFAKRTKEYLAEWIRRNEEQQKLAPTVIRMQGTAVWQQKAMERLSATLPSEAKELNDELRKGFERLREALPLPTQYDVPYIELSTTSSAAVTGNEVYEALISFDGSGFSDQPEIAKSIHEYELMQKAEGRFEEAKRRLGLLYPELAGRFTLVEQSYRTAGGDRISQEGAALDIRTFIEKFYGELFASARKQPLENMTWEKMVDRLSTDSRNRSMLCEQGLSYNNMKSVLSNIGKGRPTSSTLSQVWPRVVDLVFIVTGCLLSSGESSLR